MNIPYLSVRCYHAFVALWWCLTLLACSLPVANAARPSNDAGLRLLQAQLPTGASLRRLDCDHLARTVRAATLTHRKDAVTILSAALTLDEWDARGKVENRLSCPCVSQLFQAVVNAAPDRAVTLLETAQALYPECADVLTETLHRLEDENVVAGSLVTSHQVAAVAPAVVPDQSALDGNPTGTGTGGLNLSLPEGTSSNPGTTNPSASSSDSDTASAGPGNSLGGSGVFGLGAGTGFPGAPSFGGGSAGGIMLPTPVPVAVTSSVND